MRPFEHVEELEIQLQLLEQSLYDARHIRYKIKNANDYEWTEFEEIHFKTFEKLVKAEIEMYRFHIELEKLLSND